MTIEEMKQIKEKRGYSFAQLADYSGVPMGTIQKIFNGITQHPRRATLDALEKVLTGAEKVYAGRAYTYDLQGVRADEVHESPVTYGTSSGHLREYTLRDYYALPEDQRAELIDGAFYDMSAPSPIHQAIIGALHFQIASHIRKNKGGCKVLMSPIDVQLDGDDRTMVQPDLLILCDRSKLKSFGICGAPDLVIEILSPSTSKKDRFLKAYKYSTAGVREYWIIDPDRYTLTVYNFMSEEDSRVEMMLEGKYGVAIYDGELEIDLDEIAAEIRELK